MSISEKDDKMMYTILIDKRSEDYIANVKDDKGKWESGQSEMEAVGKLILSHPKLFDIEIKKKVWK